MNREVTSLAELLDRIHAAGDDGERVSLGAIIEAVGSRSFGPLLLMIGVLMVSPLSGIPGMATTSGVLVLLIAVQLFFRKRYFWLPRFVLNRSIGRERLRTGIKWLRKPARVIDRWIRPRLLMFVRGPSTYLIAIICAIIAAGMPMMELVPFSASSAGLALSAFGLSLIADDGLLALLAFASTAFTLGLVINKLLYPMFVEIADIEVSALNLLSSVNF